MAPECGTTKNKEIENAVQQTKQRNRNPQGVIGFVLEREVRRVPFGLGGMNPSL